MVDQHLKRYKCQFESCKFLHFSSTASLLRHDREAHGMHGGVVKPYMCPHENCERSSPGNGFPRLYNLQDHRRRVHHDPDVLPFGQGRAYGDAQKVDTKAKDESGAKAAAVKAKQDEEDELERQIRGMEEADAERERKAAEFDAERAAEDNLGIKTQSVFQPASLDQAYLDIVALLGIGTDNNKQHPTSEFDQDIRGRTNNWSVVRTHQGRFEECRTPGPGCINRTRKVKHTREHTQSTMGGLMQNSSVAAKRYNQRKMLRVRIKGQEQLACPDSGSERNIMSHSFQKQHRFKLRQGPSDIRRFQLGSGKYVRSIGRVYAPVELIGNNLIRRKRWFDVFPDCPVPLVLGMPFLNEAEILTRNRHMLEDCPAEMNDISAFLWIGSPKQRMNCFIDGRELVAIADTGSDLNLMSLKCATREGFHIDRRREARRRIRVGDGTETETIGQVHVSALSLDWRRKVTISSESEFDLPPSLPEAYNALPTNLQHTPARDAATSTPAIFHILPGLPCDVILSRDFLNETDAFDLYPNRVSQTTLPEEQDIFMDKKAFVFNIFINLGPVAAFFCRRKASSLPRHLHSHSQEDHDNSHHAEMHRRLKARDRIATLPDGVKAVAEEMERRKIAWYNSSHSTCLHCRPR